MKTILKTMAILLAFHAAAFAGGSSSIPPIKKPGGAVGDWQYNNNGNFGGMTGNEPGGPVIVDEDGMVPSELVNFQMTPGATFYIANSATRQVGAGINIDTMTVNGAVTFNSVPSSGFGNDSNRLTFSLSNSVFATQNNMTFRHLGSNTPSTVFLETYGNDFSKRTYLSLGDGSFAFANQDGSLFSGNTTGVVFPQGIQVPTTLEFRQGPQSWSAGQGFNLDLVGRFTFAGTTQGSTVGRIRARVDGTNGGSGAPYGGMEFYASRVSGPTFIPMLSILGSTGGLFDAPSAHPDIIVLGPGRPTVDGVTRAVQLQFGPGAGSTATVTYVSGEHLVFNTTLESEYGIKASTGEFATGLTVAGQNVCQEDGTNCPDSGGCGDMTKAVYDVGDNAAVDEADHAATASTATALAGFDQADYLANADIPVCDEATEKYTWWGTSWTCTTDQTGGGGGGGSTLSSPVCSQANSTTLSAGSWTETTSSVTFAVSDAAHRVRVYSMGNIHLTGGAGGNPENYGALYQDGVNPYGGFGAQATVFFTVNNRSLTFPMQYIFTPGDTNPHYYGVWAYTGTGATYGDVFSSICAEELP